MTNKLRGFTFGIDIALSGIRKGLVLYGGAAILLAMSITVAFFLYGIVALMVQVWQ